MVVGVDVLVRAETAAEDLVGAVGDHLVRDHVHRHARAGVEWIEPELIDVLASEHLVTGFHDGVAAFRIETAGLGVRNGLGLLDRDERADERGERLQPADRVVLDAPLCLRAPQGVGRYLDLAEGVFFAARGVREAYNMTSACRRIS